MLRTGMTNITIGKYVRIHTMTDIPSKFPLSEEEVQFLITKTNTLFCFELYTATAIGCVYKCVERDCEFYVTCSALEDADGTRLPTTLPQYTYDAMLAHIETHRH